MPHVHIKIVGQSEARKARLAADITQVVMSVTGCEEAAVSVSVEDVDKGDWVERVYKPDILGRGDILYKKPGYDPLK